jgi:hypothetical protein
MRRAVSVFGWFSLVLASALILLGIASWPPGAENVPDTFRAVTA